MGTGFTTSDRVGDVNGDGKADVLQVTSGNGVVTLSTGSSFSAWTTWDTSGQLQTSDLFIDVTGDRKADVLQVASGGTLKVWPSDGPAVNLLSRITHGLGATTTIAYTPSTQYTNTRLPYPVHTVSTVTTNDGNGQVAMTSYTYAGGYHHIAEREFRGFNYAKVTGPVGPHGEQVITETWFHQGNDVAVGVNNPNVATGYLKGKPYRTTVSRVGSPNVPLTDTTTSYLADTDGMAPWYTPPAVVTTTVYDNAGAVAKITQRETVSYDLYGNATLLYDRGDATNNNALTSDDTTTAVTGASSPCMIPTWGTGAIPTMPPAICSRKWMRRTRNSASATMR